MDGGIVQFEKFVGVLVEGVKVVVDFDVQDFSRSVFQGVQVDYVVGFKVGISVYCSFFFFFK